MAGEAVVPHPLQPLIELAARTDPPSPLLAGTLTATYPTALNEQLGEPTIVNYPNQGTPLTALLARGMRIASACTRHRWCQQI